MEITELSRELLLEASWNANRMDDMMLDRLRASIERYGLVENLVVRPMTKGHFEVLSGNQRLEILRSMGVDPVPCVVVALNDAEARLLSQALNRIQGEDDLGLKAALIQNILETLPQSEVLALLPESCESLSALARLVQETMAGYLESWQLAQAARLRHMSFQLLPSQLEVVEEAMERLLPRARAVQDESPNVRGRALYLMCQEFLETEESQ